MWSPEMRTLSFLRGAEVPSETWALMMTMGAEGAVDEEGAE